MLLIGNNEFINSHHILGKANKRIENRIDDFAKYINNRVYDFLFMDKLLNNQKQHIHSKRRNLRFGEESSMKDEYLEVMWKEGDDIIPLIERKMLKEYSSYPLIGNYEVNPKIFNSDIADIIRFSIEDEE